ncbi:MAG: transposase [Bacteroidetes bacterium]|nr:transposase [Bacteroidota bacterium]
MPVCPFEHSSGTSIRGRNKVSHKANKRLKSLLLCARQAPCKQRRVQGKNKFVVINAIRNKIIHRVCACVREDRLYTKFPKTVA